MLNLARHRVLHVWIAMLAVLFGALAPAVSHALASTGATSMQMEICTMDGMKSVAVDSGSQPGEPVGHLMKHCCSCSPLADPWSLLPAAHLHPAMAPAADRHPPLFYQAPRALFPWTAAKPRAPPAATGL